MLTVYDVTKELSEPSISKLFDAYAEHGGMNGKFLRLHDLILIAPMVPRSLVPGQPIDVEPQHIAIVEAAFNSVDPVLQERTRDANEQSRAGSEIILRGDDNYAVNDAGHFGYTAGRLHILGNSFKFGQASEIGREYTLLLAQQAVGETIKVV